MDLDTMLKIVHRKLGEQTCYSASLKWKEIKWAVCLDLTSTKGARVLATPENKFQKRGNRQKINCDVWESNSGPPE